MLGRVARTAGGLLVATTIFLVVGEGLTRALGIVDRLNGYMRQMFVAGPNADLPYRLRPGLETTVFGAHATVNALGLRGRETTVVAPPGTFRVLVLGDSVVFGHRVEDDETFPEVLARRLAAARGTPVEALNAGVQGYDSVAEAAFLEGPGRELAPQAVVVGTSLNDYDGALTYDPTGVLTRRVPGDTAPGLLARSEFVLLLRWIGSWSRGELLTQALDRMEGATPPANEADAAAAVDRAVGAEHLRFYHAPDAARLARLRSGYVRLRDAAAASGVPLVIAIFPEAYQVGVAEPDRTPQTVLLAMCVEVGVRCIDLLPAFEAARGDLFRDVQHPNARGLAIAADVVAASLVPAPGA